MTRVDDLAGMRPSDEAGCSRPAQEVIGQRRNLRSPRPGDSLRDVPNPYRGHGGAVGRETPDRANPVGQPTPRQMRFLARLSRQEWGGLVNGPGGGWGAPRDSLRADA